MAPRPWRPAAELEAALERGDLRFAMTLAEEVRLKRGKPIPLDVAARFLPLIARESPGEYDALGAQMAGPLGARRTREWLLR
jgi:hypothetical protein